MQFYIRYFWLYLQSDARYFL